jgi:hypothetical protein
MTFLNPIVLVGLVAAAVPVLIHLLNLRKLRTIEFSSLAFLKDLQRSSIRRLKLRQILLLVLRTLLVLAIVVAFARPALRGSMMGLPSGEASASMVILLDDSPSMGLANEHGTLLAQAQETVEGIVAQAGEDDRLMLIPLSTLPSGNERPAEGREAVTKVLRELRPTAVSVPYGEALRRARTLLADAPEAQREVYLLGDGQATQFEGDSTRMEEDPRLGVFVLAVRPSSTENLAAGPVELRSQILAPGRALDVACELSNFGESAAAGIVASLYFDSVRVAQQSSTIQGRVSHTVLLNAIARRAGTIAGTVQLDDDPLVIDNTSYFTVTVPERVSVLIAGAEGPETHLPELALTLGGDTTIAARFEVTTVQESRLPFAQFAAYDAVLLSGVSRFSEAEAARLASYVRDGGGLVIFPGAATDLQNYNRVLLDRLGLPAATVRDLSGSPGAQGSFLSFASIDVDHPLFTGMFEQERAGTPRAGLPIESPRITRVVAPIGAGHTIIGLAGGAPFLTEFRIGQGKVMVFGVDAGAGWSDFPFKGIYAPLLHQMILYLSTHTDVPERYTTGTGMELTLQAVSSPGEVFVLRSPDGTDERLVPSGTSASGTIGFRAGPPGETGFYHLVRQGPGKEEPLLTVPVNLPRRESDLSAASREQMSEFLQHSGVQSERIRWIESPANVGQTLHEARYGVDLWRHFLILALLLALAEMVVARDRTRKENL